jgi:hypothetical protein
LSREIFTYLAQEVGKNFHHQDTKAPREVAQGSLSSPAAFVAARAFSLPPKARRGGKAAGLESEPCATTTYQIHNHENAAVIKDGAPQSGHAIKARAMSCGGNGQASKRSWAGTKSRGINKTVPRYVCFGNQSTGVRTVQARHREFRAPLILRRPLGMIDDEDFHGALC